MREYKITVYGATGFTGGLVAKYLSQHHEIQKGNITWAVAGRNKHNLQKLAASLGERVAAVLADSSDLSALEDMAANTDVVINCAGPFALAGPNLIEACITKATHYVDVTGEITWVRKMMTIPRPTESIRSVICPMAGFDSTPADLGSYLLRQSDPGLTDITCYVKSFKGTASGGTLETIRQLISNDRRELVRSVLDANYLCPNLKPVMSFKNSGSVGIWPVKKPESGWTGPWMGSVNARVVTRSASLEGGALHTYKEQKLSGNFLWAVLYFIGVLLLGVIMVVPPLRWLAFRFVFNKPGQGPSAKQLLNGYADLLFVSNTGKTVQLTMHCDPGYKATSIMVAELALILAFTPQTQTGFMTPATVGGDALVERLQKAENGSAFTIKG
eukprot:TRINITY_DN37224_c0_g1_i1.p1 TRINITY_DN37224_c0_g1~~TRINITY_DN37224_c0_g1_i1.p1  ORF type:complete len:399 (+),score=62.77 TRINITY_DN37224_c0_g1_i1:38-1198(+)